MTDEMQLSIVLTFGGLHTCRDQLVVLTVWVVQELLKPSEDLAHVFFFKDFMHGRLQCTLPVSGSMQQL